MINLCLFFCFLLQKNEKVFFSFSIKFFIIINFRSLSKKKNVDQVDQNRFSSSFFSFSTHTHRIDKDMIFCYHRKKKWKKTVKKLAKNETTKQQNLMGFFPFVVVFWLFSIAQWSIVVTLIITTNKMMMMNQWKEKKESLFNNPWLPKQSRPVTTTKQIKKKISSFFFPGCTRYTQ